MWDYDEKYEPAPRGQRIAAALLAGALVLIAAVLLSGCSNKPERSIVLIDPASGCRYVMTQYGDGFMSGDYVKPQTDHNGKQVCEKGEAR